MHGVVAAATPRMATADAPQRNIAPLKSPVFSKRLLGVFGTSGLKTTSRRQKGRQKEAVTADEQNRKVLHVVESFGTRYSSSLSKSAKGASTAGGWQRMTKLRGRKGRLRQIWRKRRLRRLRTTALPSLRRTTKTWRRLSRPRRIQRQGPLTQAIAALDGQALAAFPPAAVDDIAPGRGAHALAKAVLVAALSIAGLKSAFHS